MNKTFSIKNIFKHQIAIPLIALIILCVVNLIMNPAFFMINIQENAAGNLLLYGDIMTVLDYGSELALLAIGMTFVTAASGGQDISVGAGVAVAGSAIIRCVRYPESALPLAIAVLVGIIAAALVGAFNGTLVSVFKIQPMIATLIMFTAGRSIAAWINNNELPVIEDPVFGYFGGSIPGCIIPTPILIAIICFVLVALILKFTNLKLYIQSVGINEKAARLNGLNPTFIKFITFVILGVFVGIVGFVKVSRFSTINYSIIANNIEMDAILAVALGGNALGGGKFSVSASILGAYVIELLTQTLYVFDVSSAALPAYKAVVVIALVVSSAPKVREWFGKVFKSKKRGVA